MKKSLNFPRRSGIFLGLLLAGISIAPLASSQTKQQDIGSRGAPTTVSGGAITAVSIVRGTDATSTTSTSFVTLPGASTTITIPSGKRAIIMARFSAESVCFGASGYCSVRITANGTELSPVVGKDFAFDSTNNNNETSVSWESHSMDRSSRVLGSGTYIIRVQYATTDPSINFRLDDWSLIVEKVDI
uniref:Peptidase domain protein n=1 Tax=Cyanothece sp. (strain PCC 7425 / ATCC 29141) TaxID=395961 RepID=B8HML7_CYAP4